MKLLCVLAFVVVAAWADESAVCPASTAVAVGSATPCTTDAQCVGSEKCCNSVCTAIIANTNVDGGDVDPTGPLTKAQRKALRQSKKAARANKQASKADRQAAKEARRAAKQAAKAAKKAERKKLKQANRQGRPKKERKNKKQMANEDLN